MYCHALSRLDPSFWRLIYLGDSSDKVIDVKLIVWVGGRPALDPKDVAKQVQEEAHRSSVQERVESAALEEVDVHCI